MTSSDPSEIATRDDLAAALTRTREAAGLSIRALARTLQAPPSTIGGYCGGRHLPPPGELRRLLLACDVDPDDIEPWLEAARRVRAVADRRINRTRAPYQGLEPFESVDADLFHGRDTVSEQIITLVSGGAPLVAVVGASGSGKSSILRAGVVPRLRAAGRTCAVITPGADPVGALDETCDVLVVDQFEEVFTLASPRARTEFLAALRTGGQQVVFGLRADFYAAAAAEATLVPALQDAQVLVGPMGEADMRAAITGPATVVGVEVEEALVDLLLAELRPRRHAESGAMPLLSHALLASWERSKGTRLTVADYRDTGGVDVAVQRTAEDVYSALEPALRPLARRIFLRLVTVDREVVVTRRLLSWDELYALDASGQGQEIVGRFVDRRLLTAGIDHVEISHEALLNAWPRLHGWVGDDHAVLHLQRQLSEAANEWHDTDRDPTLLWRGVRLDAATELRADPVRNAELSTREREFTDAGVALAASEATRERRRGNRLRTLLAATLTLLVAAVLLGVIAQQARLSAESAQRAAATARDDALSRQVAVTAQLLRQSNPTLAQQLILAAYRIAPTSVVRAAMIDASASPVQTRILGHPGPTPLGLSPDGHLLADADAVDGSIRLYRIQPGTTPKLLARIDAPRPVLQYFALTFSPDGRMLAAGGQDHAVRLWDVSTPTQPVAVTTLSPGFPDSVESIAFSPDGNTLVAASDGPHPVQAWDVRDTAAIRLLTAPGGIKADTTIFSIAFDHSGLLAAAGSGGVVYLWPQVSGARPITFSGATDRITALAFDPRRPKLYVGDAGGRTRAWSLAAATPAMTATISDSGATPVTAVAISRDGARLAIGLADDTVSQRFTSSLNAAPFATTPGGGPVTGVAYGPDGTYLFITNADGTMRVRAPPRNGIPVDGTAFNLVYNRSATRLAVFTNGGDGARLWDPRTSRAYGPPLQIPGTMVGGSGTMSADGSLVVAGDATGRIMLWDTSDPARPRVLAGPMKVATDLVETIAINPAATLLAVASDDGNLTVLDIRDRHTPRKLAVLHRDGQMFGAAFSRNGLLLAGGSTDKSVWVWNVADPSQPRQVAHLGGFESYVYGVTFSPTEDVLAAASSDATVRLWDLTDPAHATPVGPVRVGPTDYAYSVAFTPDGKRFAVASNDRTVRVYRVHSGTVNVPELTLEQPNAPVWSVVFTPDGKTLTSGGRDPSLASWSLDPATFAANLCSVIGDPITRDEWAIYVPGAKYDPPCR